MSDRKSETNEILNQHHPVVSHDECQDLIYRDNETTWRQYAEHLEKRLAKRESLPSLLPFVDRVNKFAADLNQCLLADEQLADEWQKLFEIGQGLYELAHELRDANRESPQNLGSATEIWIRLKGKSATQIEAKAPKYTDSYYGKDVSFVKTTFDKAVEDGLVKLPISLSVGPLSGTCPKCQGNGALEVDGQFVPCECQAWLAQQCFKGNSVGFIYDKMQARGVQIDRVVKERDELKAEVTRLHRVIAKELTENDELGCEYTYVIALKAEVERLKHYAEHSPDCFYWATDDELCSCGLSEATKPKEST